MSINIDVGKKYFVQKSKRMKRPIFNVLQIFALKLLFFEKNKIKWNQTERHAMGSFYQFKSSPIKWNGIKQFFEKFDFSNFLMPFL